MEKRSRKIRDKWGCQDVVHRYMASPTSAPRTYRLVRARSRRIRSASCSKHSLALGSIACPIGNEWRVFRIRLAKADQTSIESRSNFCLQSCRTCRRQCMPIRDFESSSTLINPTRPGPMELSRPDIVPVVLSTIRPSMQS